MPQRLVDPSEFADDIQAPAQSSGRRQVDPSEFADTPATDTGHTPEEGHPWLAAGARGLAGILGVEGGLTGAGIAGLGETAAEALEQGTLHPNINAARVGVATGMGAIPLSSVFKAGAPLYSAIRGGVQAAAGTGLNQWAEGKPIDPEAIALSGGIGAATGGITSGVLGKFLGGKAPAITDETLKSSQPYGPYRQPPPVDVNPITGQKTFRVPPEAIPKSPYPTPTPSGPDQYEYGTDISSGLGKLLKPALGGKADIPGLQAGIDEATAQGAAKRAANFKADTAATKAEQMADAAWYNQQQQAAQVADKAQQALERQATIEKAIKDAGLQKQGITVGESISAPTEEGGNISMRTRYGVPETQGATQAGELTPEEFADLVVQRQSARDNAPVGPPATPTVSEPTVGITPEQSANEARAEAATSGVTQPNPSPAQEAAPSQLLKFFGGDNPKVSAVGQAYRAAKAEPDINPLTTQQLGAALTHQAAQEGLPTAGGTNFAKFLQNRISPDIEGKFAAAEKSPMSEVPTTSGGPESPGISETPQVSGGQDWIQHQNDLIDGFNEYKKSLLNNQGGFLSQNVLHQLFAPLTGAAIGAPVGAALNEDDPLTGAMEGTAAGGMLGYYATAPSSKAAIDQLIQIRNMGMLMGPAQIKKHLSDLGAYGSNVFEQAFAGRPDLAKNLVHEAFNPENALNYWKAFKATLQGQVPESAQHVIGDAATTAAERIANAGMYERFALAPIAAAQDATFKAMLRAGMSPEEAEKVLLLGNPETKLGQWRMSGQALPGVGGQIMRTVSPFARIATNLAERGLERTPGIGLLMPGENKAAKQIAGLGAMGIGVGSGMWDAAQDPDNQTSPMMKGLRRASFASYGLPYTIGEALGGTDWTDVGRMFPGITLPPAKKGESLPVTYGKTLVKQILPSWILPDSGSAR